MYSLVFGLFEVYLEFICGFVVVRLKNVGVSMRSNICENRESEEHQIHEVWDDKF